LIFPCSTTQTWSRAALAGLFRKLGDLCPRFLAFEIGETMAPYGRLFDLATITDLLQIPTLIGLKHSSLNRKMEWERLALRDQQRPDFKIYSGNNLATDMIKYGSDYILELAAFHPSSFVLRDTLWARQDLGFHVINDLLHYLSHLAFRSPYSSYQHSLGQFLHLQGLIPKNSSPSSLPPRPESDVLLMQDILDQLNQAVEKFQPAILSHKPE
jgi:dihydrodipicolinate synthase/N-acetylneuraminate lyase